MANDVCRILLVDDDEDDYLLIRDFLADNKERQFHLDWANTYPAALKQMEACQHDLYLLDYFLGERDGLDLLHEARRDGCTGPAILLTGQSNRSLDLEAMYAGVSDYLVKGQFDATLLERSIRYAIERRRVEEELQASREELEEAQRLAHLGNWTWDIATNVVTWSDELYRIYGLQPQELAISYDSFFQQVHPDDRQMVSKIIEKALQDHAPFDYHHRLLRPDGSVRVLHGRGDVITDEAGQPVKMFGTGQDVSERQQTEEMLQRTKDQLYAVLNAVPGAVSWINADLKYCGLNQFLARLYNLRPETFIGRPIGFLNQDSEFVRYVEGFFASPDKATSREIHMKVDGSDRLYLLVAQKYHEGHAAVFVGLDITERKRAEEALRRNEEKFRSLIENGLDIITVIDADGVVHYGSPSIERVLGYATEDIAGKNVFDYIHPDDAPQILSIFSIIAQNPNAPLEAEFRFRHKDGAWRTLEAIGKASLDDVTEGFVINARDITERKQAEAALQKAHDELEARVLARTSELAIMNAALQEEIAERKQAEQEVRQSEQRYRTLIKNIPSSIVLLFDHDLRYTIADGAVLPAIGVMPQDLEGKTIWEALSPRNLEMVEPHYRAALVGESHTFEMSSQDRRYLVHTLPVKNEHGEITAGMSLAQNITERHLSEQRQAMRQTVTELLSQDVSFELSITDILQVITEGMTWDYGAFWLVDNQGQRLHYFKSWHGSDAALDSLDELNQDMTFALGDGYLGRVWDGGRPLWISDVAQDETFLRKAVVEQGELRSSLAFPIRFGGEILGIMEFFSRQIQEYDPGMLNALEGLGSQIGQFMERKHAQEALRESEARKSAILESSLDAILTMDHEGKVIEWNPAAESMFGYSRAKAIGCAMVELIFAPGAENVHLDALKCYLATGEGPFADQHYEFVAVHVDGSEFPVELGISLIHLDDKPLFTAYIRDITRRQLDERALQQAKEEAEHALIEAERANRAKSEFLSRMSHELRTPMNSILGFGQLLKMEQLAPKQDQKIDYILKAGQHLLELINEVLDIARVESGRISLSVEPVRICDLIHDTVALVEPLADRRHITLDTQQGVSCDRSVLVDRQRCHQVLLNLLSNAIKYNREGGQVLVACEEDNDHHLKVTVRDTGEGIRAEDLERVFQPFERLEAEVTNIEGSGLGLALSKNFVEAMKGSIGVESVVGQGSTFWITLPLAQDQMVHHKQSGGHEMAIAAADASVGNVGTVLYIEDNLANLLVVESILSYQAGIKLITAMQGGLGLELAREHHPALILLDLHLPDTTGDEVLRRLKIEPGLRDIPVVVLSADATPGQIEDLKAAGAQHYLTKPLDVQRFLEVINETF